MRASAEAKRKRSPGIPRARYTYQVGKSPATEARVIDVLGLNLICCDESRAPILLDGLAAHAKRSKQGLAFHLTNAYTLALASGDPALAQILRTDLSFSDGVPFTWFVRSRVPSMKQVYGPKLLENSLALGGVHRHFFYGSTPQVNEHLLRALITRFPNTNIVGGESPPFTAITPEARRALAGTLEQLSVDVIWVGLGTPKQDIEVHELAKLYPGVFIAVGAAFDFLSGNIRDCPEFIRRLGLQWLYRLIREPRRMWKRYLVGNTKFLLVLAKSRKNQWPTYPLADWLDQKRFPDSI